MLRRIFTYTNFNNEEVTEECFFNLTKSEILDMEMSTYGGMAARLQRIVDAKDSPSLMKEFKDLIFKAYGVKSPDGRRFIKSAELSEEFSQTPAYDQLFMELVSDDGASAAFINGIIPQDLQDNPEYQNALKAIDNKVTPELAE